MKIFVLIDFYACIKASQVDNNITHNKHSLIDEPLILHVHGLPYQYPHQYVHIKAITLEDLCFPLAVPFSDF